MVLDGEVLALSSSGNVSEFKWRLVARSSQTGVVPFIDNRSGDGSARGGLRRRGGNLWRCLGFRARFDGKSDQDGYFYRGFSPYYL
jgi:hypothetical protein